MKYRYPVDIHEYWVGNAAVGRFLRRIYFPSQNSQCQFTEDYNRETPKEIAMVARPELNPLGDLEDLIKECEGILKHGQN